MNEDGAVRPPPRRPAGAPSPGSSATTCQMRSAAAPVLGKATPACSASSPGLGPHEESLNFGAPRIGTRDSCTGTPAKPQPTNQPLDPQTSQDATRMPGIGMSTPASIDDFSNALWHRVNVYLRILSAPKRREVLVRCFSQPQRLAFEAWLLARKRSAASSGQTANASHQLSPSSLPCSVSDLVSDSDLSRSDYPWDDAICDGVSDSDVGTGALPICDQHLGWGCDDSASSSSSGEGKAESECFPGRHGRSFPPSDIGDADDVFWPNGCDVSALDRRILKDGGRESGEAGNGTRYESSHQELLGSKGGVADGGTDMVMAAPRNKSGVRGICKARFHSPTYFYSAVVNVKNMRIGSRFSQQLDVAIDNLVVITALKQRIIDSSDINFAERFRDALQAVMAENGMTVDSLGMWFRIEVQKKGWMRSSIYTPTFHDLGHALDAWTRLSSYFWKPGRRIDRSLDAWMHEMHSEWPAFRGAYLDIMVECGKSREHCDLRLRALERDALPIRERYIALWNIRAMEADEQRQRRSQARFVAELERWNRSAMLVEERRQRQVHAWERLAERRGRRAMALEEFRQRRVAFAERRMERRACRALALEDCASRAWGRRLESAEERAVFGIRRLLCRWQRRQAERCAIQAKREAQAAAAADRRERCRQQAQLRAEAANARISKQVQKAERRARWRWMNRRNITMADLLG